MTAKHEHYTCRDCTGRGGELVVFSITIGGEPYEHEPTHCPICGQSSTVESVSDYKEREG